MIKFYKFHGTGNDFIMLDGRELKTAPNADEIRHLCHRQMGIGADGLIIIKPVEGYDFEMTYFNADGSLATMCGNGARCAVAFGFISGMSGPDVTFRAGDGGHTGKLQSLTDFKWMVEISMGDISIPEITGVSTEIHTGTPHLVIITQDPDSVNVPVEGRRIRYSEAYRINGINVNFLSIRDNRLKVRTYEKGVEDETLSCGTGVTACAAVAALKTGINNWFVETRGGAIEVKLKKNKNFFENVRLKGPAAMVFSGELTGWIHG
ncbi:Diaminopimelate epimerase [bioreactor metagenome]|jgi:diaminopimelate epimerase|uniref:diaminopimelate epimerase n=1 Tax=bioreactor metagenome TaxID=1076179 RepID=A0A644U369_9ZZZZ|nr:diaminopimelate epimerase [Lentimicrobium sp.]MEA5109769.1 diaminopimelate epimerase [Lentimicrobium sp.]